MKKLALVFMILGLCACSHHTKETIVGYNEEGKTLVRVCKSVGNLASQDAFGSECTIELRDYGRITTKTETVNVISADKR